MLFIEFGIIAKCLCLHGQTKLFFYSLIIYFHYEI